MASAKTGPAKTVSEGVVASGRAVETSDRSLWGEWDSRELGAHLFRVQRTSTRKTPHWRAGERGRCRIGPRPQRSRGAAGRQLMWLPAAAPRGCKAVALAAAHVRRLEPYRLDPHAAR